MNNLKLRTISGLVLVAILVSGIVISPITKFIVLSIVGLGTLNEMLKLFSKSGVAVAYGGIYTLISAVIMLLTAAFASAELIYVAVLLLIIRFIIELYRKKKRPLEGLGYEIFAFIYALMPIYLLIEIADYRIVLSIFILVWTNDVGAYLVGSKFGKRRLFERISPKKSWEGFWGGLILVVIVAALIGNYWIGYRTGLWMITGVVVSIAAVYGDLFESMFKRSIGVKDSGNSIPGHGGFWDRFDALFLAAPAYVVIERLLTILVY